MRRDFDMGWKELSQEVMAGMKQWRLEHQQATLSEIEQALDQRLGRMRARMLEDLALASAASDLRTGTDAQRAACLDCGSRLESRGQKLRQLRTHSGQPLRLRRSYGVCPTCQVGFFPPGSRTGAAGGGTDTPAARKPGEARHLDAFRQGRPRTEPLYRRPGQ